MTQEEAKNYVATQVYDNNNKEVKAGNVRNSVNKAIDYTKEIEDKVATIGSKVGDLQRTSATKTELNNIKPIVVEGDVTNAQDEEDLTSENGLLKFKNRTATSSEMGNVILRKNKSFASQVTQANTIYVIRYAFDLSGATVTIPEGCTLKFEGGNISNGIIIGNNTTVVSSTKNCFSLSVSLEGVWDAEIAKSSWFSTIDDCVLDSYNFIAGNDSTNGLINLFKFPNVELDNGNYLCKDTLNCFSGQTINGHGASIKFMQNTVTYCIKIDNCTNVEISNLNIIGYKESGSTSIGGHGIRLSGSNGVRLNNVNSSYAQGDGIYLRSNNVYITNSLFDENYRQGISITKGENVTIDGCIISNTTGTDPQAGIDIEPNENDTCSQIKVTNCKFVGNNGASITTNGNKIGSKLSHVLIKGIVSDSGIHIGTSDYTTVEDFEAKGIVCMYVRGEGTTDHLTIRNGRIEGSTNENSEGIEVSGTNLYNFLLDNVEIFNCGKFGLMMATTDSSKKYKNIALTNLNVHNCCNNVSVRSTVENLFIQNLKTRDIGIDKEGNLFPRESIGHDRRINLAGSVYDMDIFNPHTEAPSLICNEESSVGQFFYNKTSRKPMWFNGVEWVDAVELKKNQYKGVVVCNIGGKNVYAPIFTIAEAIKYTGTKKFIDLSVGIGNVVNITSLHNISVLNVAVIECKEGDNFILRGKGSTSGRLWGFVDANNLLLSVSEPNATETNLNLVAPENSKYLIFHNRLSDGLSYKLKNIINVESPENFGYVVDSFDGIDVYQKDYGKIILLRKDKTFNSQVEGLINKVFEIRFDFDLGGQTVTIGEGCTLRFVGGSITNGTIIGNNTNVEGYYNISASHTGLYFGVTPTLTTGTKIAEVNGVAIYAPKNGYGTTRPQSPQNGEMYFDTTLAKPIFYTEDKWVDASGAEV